MGSALSSSNGKGCLSMRKIGSAAAFVCVALILVVAAGAATLHHHPTPVHTTNSTSVRIRVPPRKILRSSEAATVESTNVPKTRNRCASNRRSSSTSGCDDPLPRGIIHATTNLEMEPSLAGDPEHRTKQQESAATTPPKPKKSLLAVPVGIKNKAVVDKLVSKFPADDFAVMLFHYDGAVEQWADVAWSERAPSPGGRASTCRSRRSTAAPRSTTPSRRALRRRVTTSTRCHHGDGGGGGGPPCAGWVEAMVPVLSRAAWRCAWGMLQNDLIHGWGLDYKLGYCAQGDRGVHVGVVDSEYVLHRGVPMLGDGGGKGTKSSAGRAAVRMRSFKEMQIFNRRWEKAAAEDESWTDPYGVKPATASSR
ncbi:hypothetical protein HU200_041239 [Digitaria exilis]|uniref:Uncharacterized protein n=1 Tax=Digitaria exilis TaxID=1010633 RepID=A0A835B8J4_9POAL|nr:hypothetical protein HU200_041239 [Digitaria exilis]